ncbi:antirestriction protein ArdA [Amycolatopsis minnesotensis]|uniref:Antirestriction protein ArdA n=1 Tax=Amycolatopsis minnesotensis TaxID=337894 RepID=A0ABN2Q0U5_9PSEU
MALRLPGAFGQRLAETEIMSSYPSIYVASLGDYNCGRLHGTWIELDVYTLTLDDVMEKVSAMLKASPSVAVGATDVAEEYAVHDAEGFGKYDVGEFDSIERLYRIAELMTENGEAFSAWLAEKGDLEEAEETWEDAYRITVDSVTCWAYEDFAEMHPEAAKAADDLHYLEFDPDAYILGLETDGYTFLALANGETAIFCE